VVRDWLLVAAGRSNDHEREGRREGEKVNQLGHRAKRRLLVESRDARMTCSPGSCAWTRRP
jgi:hypothetical protein